MYIPEPFSEDDPAVLAAIMREHSFGLLVTQRDGQLLASHLPFLLDEARGPLGTLRAHMARGNPQADVLMDGAEALVVFQGPDAYISPSWYNTVPSVPTWNYVAVHAHGTARLVDEAALHGILRDLVAKHEAGPRPPWVLDPPADYMRRMMAGIVGLEMPITRLDGKLKLGQHRSDADRDGAIAGLRATGDHSANRMADWMQAVAAR